MRRHFHIVYYLSLSLFFITNLCADKAAQTVEKSSASYPGRKPEICFTDFTAAEKKRGLINVVIDTYQASLLSPNSVDSLWDHDFLKQNINFKIALDEYIKGKRGQKIKLLDLHHKTAEEIHTILIKSGFKHKRTPVMVHKIVVKDRGHYWLKSGEMTTDPTHADLVIMDIYVHDDGSMVRVKPESTPDFKRRTALRFPHYSKVVLLDMKDICDDKKVCAKDISYANEAFKLTREGNPLPKNIKPESGFRYLYPKTNKRKRAMQADVIMNLIHFNLPTECLRKADWLDDPIEVDSPLDTSDTTVKKDSVVEDTNKVTDKKVVTSVPVKTKPVKKIAKKKANQNQ